MIFSSLDHIRDDRTCKALTGVTKDQFKQLAQVFEASYKELQQGSLKTKPRQSSSGNLKTFEHKLFFVLYYLKNYPTYDVLGYLFDFSGGHAFDHLEKLLPILQRSLAQLKVLPERTVQSVEELERLLTKHRTVMLDATERATFRPQDPESQAQRYSGKKNTTRSRTS
jgi:DDE superfamily endonuclease